MQNNITMSSLRKRLKEVRPDWEFDFWFKLFFDGKTTLADAMIKADEDITDMVIQDQAKDEYELNKKNLD